MKRVAIIGGGISGLTAAFHLEKARTLGADLRYTVIEAGQRRLSDRPDIPEPVLIW